MKTNARSNPKDGINDLSIPDKLKRKPSDKPAEPKATAATARETPKSKYGALEKPKGMTDEEYEAAKAKYTAVKEAKNEAKEAKQAKQKAKQPANTFKLTPWATAKGLHPKQVRIVARADRKGAKAMASLEVDGQKYVYLLSDEAKIDKAVREGLAELGRKKKMPNKAKPEVVRTGKAKVSKPASTPAPVSQKEENRKEAAKAVKKAKITKVK